MNYFFPLWKVFAFPYMNNFSTKLRYSLLRVQIRLFSWFCSFLFWWILQFMGIQFIPALHFKLNFSCTPECMLKFLFFNPKKIASWIDWNCNIPLENEKFSNWFVTNSGFSLLSYLHFCSLSNSFWATAQNILNCNWNSCNSLYMYLSMKRRKEAVTNNLKLQLDIETNTNVLFIFCFNYPVLK